MSVINPIINLKPNCLAGLILKASICHKSKLPPKKNTYHWPYERRPYRYYNFFLDPFTSQKMDENSKIVQVEGNVAAGKENIARGLADEWGMLYMPPVDIDQYYINRHGFDYRAFNVVLPERMRHCDSAMFHENPSRHSVIHMQHFLFKLRIFQYMKALRHLLNTGQGVVMHRSVYTERVFVEAMHELGWLPRGYVRGDGVRFYDWRIRYNYIRNLILEVFPKPHLTVYVDTPVDVCLDRIKEDADPMISESKALTKEFLEAIEKGYNDVVLPKQEYNGHLVKIDGSKELTRDEIMDVVDDVEMLDFELDNHDTRFQSWDTSEKRLWYFHKRKLYSSLSCMRILLILDQPLYDIAGLGDSISQIDIRLREALYEGHVSKLGGHQDFWTNPDVHGFLKSFLHIPRYAEQLEHCQRSDFL